jgi:quercetin dioxygenase-like cupin family protein
MLREIEAPAAGTQLDVVGDELTVLLPSAGTGGAFEVFEVCGPRDSGPPPHEHPWLEAYYVLEGEVAVTQSGTEVVHGPGAFLTTPAGMTHTYRIASEQARFLVITTGDRASVFFADVAANVPPGAPTPESLPTLIEVAKRNGLTSPLF